MSCAIKCSLLVLVLVGLGLGLVYTRSAVEAEVSDYDANGNGALEKDEVLEVLILYFLSDTTPEPTPNPSLPEELRPRQLFRQLDGRGRRP